MANEPAPVHGDVPPTDMPPAIATHEPSRFPAIALLFAAGLVAGAAATFAIEQYGSFFKTPPFRGPSPPPSVQKIITENAYRNAAVSGGLFGVILGGVLGLAAGLSRRSVPAAVVGLVAGALLGAAAGSGGVWLDFAGWQEALQGGRDLATATIVLHAVAFCLMGLGVGLGIGLANGGVVRVASSAAAAGLIAGLLCSPISGIALPMADTDQPIPRERTALLIWTMLPAGLMGLAAGRALPPPSVPKVTDAPA